MDAALIDVTMPDGNGLDLVGEIHDGGPGTRIPTLALTASLDEAELSDGHERTALTDTTHAWLLSLRRRLVEIEEDTPEAFGKRKQLVGLLVESISLGKRQEDGRVETQITYRFGPSPDSEAESVDDSSMAGFKNGRESITPDTNTPTLTVVAVR